MNASSLAMKTTQPYSGPSHPKWWTVSDEYPVGSQTLTPGRQLTLKGGRTVFTFVNHTVAPPRPGSGKRKTQEWITLTGTGGYRAVRPSQVGRVLPPPATKSKRARKTP